MDVMLRKEDEGQQGGDQLPSMDKFNSVGRNSLDIFSPVRGGEAGHLLLSALG